MSQIDLLTEIKSLPAKYFELIAGEALGAEGVVVLDKPQVVPLDVVSMGTGTRGIVRCVGTAETDGESLRWSTVLKALVHGESNRFGDTTDDMHTETEVDVYRTGLFENRSGNYRSAKCYDIDDRSNGESWLWLEDLSSYSIGKWTDNQYLTAAYEIGRFRGGWLLSSSLPSIALSKHNFGKGNYGTTGMYGVLRTALLDSADSEFVRDSLPGELFARVVNLWDSFEVIIGASRRLPATVAQTDCHVRNLFASNGPEPTEIVAVDFSGVSIEHLGMDAGNLFGSGFSWSDEEAERCERISDRFYQRWFEGLVDSGVEIDSNSARIGFMAMVYLRSIGTAGIPAVIVQGGARAEFMLSRYQGDRDEIPNSYRRRMEYLVPLCEDVLRMVA